MIGLRRRFAPWVQPTYWALDLETSGLDSKSDTILSVGLVPVRSASIRWGERFYSLVSGAADASGREASLGVHQILPGESHEAPGEEAIVDRLGSILIQDVLLVHHAHLDVRFLRAAFARCRRRWPRPPVVDTVVLLHRLEMRLQRLEPYPKPVPRGLAGARHHLDLPPHREHHALADAMATAELFLVLARRLDVRRLGELL